MLDILFPSTPTEGVILKACTKTKGVGDCNSNKVFDLISMQSVRDKKIHKTVTPFLIAKYHSWDISKKLTSNKIVKFPHS